MIALTFLPSLLSLPLPRSPPLHPHVKHKKPAALLSQHSTVSPQTPAQHDPIRRLKLDQLVLSCPFSLPFHFPLL
ncbi:hypothetical protein L873DRAFT_1811292 [Choiromyces venosus 120613-1]|uniref:Uncharacterized protein n=1 Tax=Choiromyces venosus 120613-1 TaxID=1336337 RepID=A0A3N4JJ42_9PEZI|nr:hypothetical protein L873DRAFT_1811292 [Choiromyces venosus 120613-1]